MSNSTKKIKVMVPGVNLDKIFGPRDEEMDESVTERKTKLDRKREELEGLELDSEILDLEERISRRKRGEPEPSQPTDQLGDTLVKEVVIPLVNRKLQEGENDRSMNSAVDRALRIAEKAVSRSPPKGESTSAMDELDKGVAIFTKIKSLIEGEREARAEAGLGTKKENDVLSDLERGIELVRKMQEVFPQEGSGGEMSDRMLEFKKWEKEFELENKKADREERLERRRIDKEHDAKMAELGIENDRNELLKDGFKRVGRAIAIALGEEDEYEEEEATPPTGKKQLLKISCEVCGKTILVPPEAQVPGKEIKCSNCNSVFVWE